MRFALAPPHPSKEDIVAFMTETFGDSAAAVQKGFAQVISKGADVASSVGESVADASGDLIRSLAKAVKRHPVAAIAIAFGGGALIIGSVMLLRRRR